MCKWPGIGMEVQIKVIEVQLERVRRGLPRGRESDPCRVLCEISEKCCYQCVVFVKSAKVSEVFDIVRVFGLKFPMDSILCKH